MSIYEKMNELFSQKEFIDSIRDLDNIEAIHAAVAAKIPEATEDEVGAYLTAIAQRLPDEIGEEDLDNVSGGGPLSWAVLGAGIVMAGAVVGLIYGCYSMGEAVGKFIKNLRGK